MKAGQYRECCVINIMIPFVLKFGDGFDFVDNNFQCTGLELSQKRDETTILREWTDLQDHRNKSVRVCMEKNKIAVEQTSK